MTLYFQFQFQFNLLSTNKIISYRKQQQACSTVDDFAY